MRARSAAFLPCSGAGQLVPPASRSTCLPSSLPPSSASPPPQSEGRLPLPPSTSLHPSSACHLPPPSVHLPPHLPPHTRTMPTTTPSYTALPHYLYPPCPTPFLCPLDLDRKSCLQHIHAPSSQLPFGSAWPHLFHAPEGYSITPRGAIPRRPTHDTLALPVSAAVPAAAPFSTRSLFSVPVLGSPMQYVRATCRGGLFRQQFAGQNALTAHSPCALLPTAARFVSLALFCCYYSLPGARARCRTPHVYTVPAPSRGPFTSLTPLPVLSYRFATYAAHLHTYAFSRGFLIRLCLVTRGFMPRRFWRLHR